MIRKGHLIKYLESSSKKLSEGAQTFYNYLWFGSTEMAFIDRGILEKFYGMTLLYPHWQERVEDLQKDIEEVLTGFWQVCQRTDAPFNLMAPQFIKIKSHGDLVGLVENHLKDTIKEGWEYKTYPLTNEEPEICAVIVKKEGIEVRVYSGVFIVKEGRFSPAPLKQNLHYDTLLNLDQGKNQVLELIDGSRACFSKRGAHITGHSISSCYLEKNNDFKESVLAQDPNVYYGIKRLEQFFLSTETDDFYQQICHEIHGVSLNLYQDAPDALFVAEKKLQTFQFIAERVYSENRDLKILVTQLSLQVKNQRSNLTQHL